MKEGDCIGKNDNEEYNALYDQLRPGDFLNVPNVFNDSTRNAIKHAARYYYSLHYMKDLAITADDIEQEFLLTAFQVVKRYEGKRVENFRALLAAALRNKFKMMLRKYVRYNRNELLVADIEEIIKKRSF